MAKKQQRPGKRAPRPNTIKVVVRMSDEPIDIEAWARRYVRTVIEHDRRPQLEQPPAPPPAGT